MGWFSRAVASPGLSHGLFQDNHCSADVPLGLGHGKAHHNSSYLCCQGSKASAHVGSGNGPRPLAAIHFQAGDWETVIPSLRPRVPSMTQVNNMAALKQKGALQWVENCSEPMDPHDLQAICSTSGPLAVYFEERVGKWDWREDSRKDRGGGMVAASKV